MQCRNKMCAWSILAVALLVAGCASDADTARSDAARQPQCGATVSATDTTALQGVLDIESFATVTEVVRDGGFVNATATAQGTVRDIHERFSRAVRRAGYSVVGSENEIIEADVYFARGSQTTGAAKFIQTSCSGRVRIQMFLGGPDR